MRQDMDFTTAEDDFYTYKKDLSAYGQILFVEMSPFNLSQDLILIGFQTKILLGHLEIDERLNLKIEAEFNHINRCTCMSMSPETSLSILPKLVSFASGGSDFEIRIFKSDLQGNDSCRILSGHTNYINDIRFDPDNTYIVSVSDDNTAKVWDAEGFKIVATLNLTSPGMVACWHREDTSKLVVSEKSGLVRFYNVETQTPILSLDYGKPLSSAHWAPSDSQLIASLQLGELLVWDLAKPCIPMSCSLLFAENGGIIKFNSSGDLIAAINNLEGHLKVVRTQNHQIKLNVAVTLPSNISWHFRSPIICVGDYNSLNFFKVTSK